MKVQFYNSDKETIYTDFTKECSVCIDSCSDLSVIVKCKLDNTSKRIGYKNESNGSIFCCTDSIDLIKSNKSFKSIQNTLLKGIEEIEKKKLLLKVETNRLIHNLTKTNAHNIQELYAVVPQEIISQNLNKQLKTISDIIVKNPEESARMFLRIAKNNATIKTEFAVFNKIFSGNSSIKKRKHKIRKVVLNLYHNFFLEFKDKNVSVNFQDNNDYIYIDYEAIHVVLYHLFDNAVKYILKGSQMFIKFSNTIDYYSIIMEMKSIRIENDEIDKIHQDGYSGELARKLKKQGHGLGIGQIDRILKIVNGELIIKNNTNQKVSTKFNGVWYDNNIFEIRLRNYAQQHI